MGIDKIKSSEVAVGGSRQLEEVSSLLPNNCQKYILGKLAELIEYLDSNRDKNITIIVSGDTGFYSLLSFLRKNYKKEELDVTPGISSYQYLFSRIGEVWQDYRLISVHGREAEYVKIFTDEKGVVLLTDNENTPFVIAKNLFDSGFKKDVEIIVGERLSYPDEKITWVNIENYKELDKKFQMNIVVVRKI